ncbi:hypothetical protein B0H14DRAFT_3567077 [Mycena olivaceomarginata]|nr:hypothetical protein B0H14DRAFT_3567077 [Mycena olivaceomarginata]
MAHRDIHSLPPETHSDIFRSAVAAVTPEFWGPRESTSTQDRRMELERAPLLILSQVCSRCGGETAHHSIPASSSPWPSTPIDGNVYKWPSSYAEWICFFYCSTLGEDLYCHAPRGLEIFERISESQTPAVVRMRGFASCGLRHPAFLDGPATPYQCSGVAQLTFGINCQTFLQHYASLKRMCLPSIVGRFSAFNVCTTMAKFNARDMATIVGRIFASVTTTQLQTPCHGVPRLPRARIAVAACRLPLDPAHSRGAHWREQVLSLLPALERLEVGDAPEKPCKRKQRGKSGKSNGVITDSFLRAISDAPGRDCLVPCLSYFACVSRLTFTHGLLVDLATSKVARLSGSSMPFHLCIRRFPGTDIVVTSAVRTALWDLAADNAKFTYDAGEMEKYKRPSRSRKSGGSKGERPFTDGSKLLETCITQEGSGLNSFWSAY